MAKRKHWQKTKGDVADRKSGSPAPWTDLEQTFFASAPPDDPEAPAEPESFDDLMPAAVATRRDLSSRVIAALSAPRLDRRLITIAIATVMLLIGLSAVVFASHH
jgi:hypothetical protein